MKQLLFVIAMVLSMAMNAEAKPTGKNKELASGLIKAMKNSGTSQVINADNYRKMSFLFNGKTVSAFFDAEGNELIGFSVPVSINDLSEEALQNMKARFDKYSFREAIMFVRRNGITEFYASMSRSNKPTIVLLINTDGKVHYFGKQ